jgi:hypothetical protein
MGFGKKKNFAVLNQESYGKTRETMKILNQDRPWVD